MDIEHFDFVEGYPHQFAHRPLVAISDGYLTYCSPIPEGATLKDAIESYASDCGFLEPGSVTCCAKLYLPGDDDLSPSEVLRVVLRSDDGRTVYVARIE